MKEDPLRNYPCVDMLGMDIVHWTIMCVFVSFVGANIVKMETIKCLRSLSLFRKSANATTAVRELHLKVVVVLYSLFQFLDGFMTLLYRFSQSLKFPILLVQYLAVA